MSKFERIAIFAALLALTFTIVSIQSGANQAHAAATRAPDPVPVRIATCDVYAVIQLLVESDRYKPNRLAEQEKARTELKEIAEQIRSLETQLKSMNPNDEKSFAIFRDLTAQKDFFAERQGDLDEFLGTQFVQAYEEVRKAADAVGERRGFSHVIASRRASEKPTADMDRITQQVLSRPILRAPSADDITEDVLSELKL